jgi:hypothetical protein
MIDIFRFFTYYTLLTSFLVHSFKLLSNLNSILEGLPEENLNL